MKLKIDSKKEGAELTSIIYNGKEMLHQAKEFWNRHAPVLFPIVGQIKNGETLINGKTYKMGQHGFARDMEFEELEKSERLHRYVLKSNEETLKKFPFDFELYITYTINDDELEVKYKVINNDNKEMIFGIGGHPAFICDYSSGNYEIEFDNNETNIRFLELENGLISNRDGKNILRENKIQLEKDTFINDAIILKNVKSNKVNLINKKENKKVLEFDFTGFKYLAFWSKVGANFICIEPWMNTADKIDSDGNFKNKEDILKLKPKENFKCRYKIRF